MDSARWAEIDALLRSALEQPPERRASFLDSACPNDPELRGEIQSLLREHEGSREFLETPALTLAARALAAHKASLIGTLVGRYQIIESLGAGGMGEVFLAQDTRLRRHVALKMLPAELATDPERVERFEQEARAASALDHPNVLTVHDVGLHEGMPYIASEFLEGETLRERLHAGRLPVAKAIEFALQIARALAAAHEAGIVHRDLKPENIFVTSDGRIKILDFGLAKLSETSTAAHIRPGNSQVVLTAPGTIMGSAGYLSPEQIRGQAVYTNSDIFSFGCVLYEMLTGRRAFAADSAAESMALILRDEPVMEPPDGIPPAVARIIRRCLEKSPAERFQSARDLAFVLETFGRPGEPEGVELQRPNPESRGSRLPWITVALLGVCTIALIPFLLLRRPAEAPLLRFEIPIPGDPITSSPALAISPDGKTVAFAALGPSGRPILWIRAMSAVAPRPIAGTEEARYPFWSADSRFLAYQVGDKLRTTEIATSSQRTICTIGGIVNGAWSADGVIIVGTGLGPLLRVGAEGSHFVPVTKLDTANGERAHWWPNFLPDSRHFLYSVNASTLEKSGIFAGSLDGGPAKRLISGVVSNAVYLPPGYLLYSRDGNLVARRFDTRRLEVSGAELRVADRLKAYYGYTAFSASQTGTVVFRSGDQGRFQLAWFDRAGKRIDAAGSGAGNRPIEGILPLAPSISPDGSWLATVQYQPTNGAYGIWATALNRVMQFPVTEASNAESAVWSPDSSRIAYSASPRGGARDLYVKRLDASGRGTLVFHSDRNKWPLDWSSDGRNLLLFYMDDDQSHSSLWVVPADGSSAPTQVRSAPQDVKDARFSPNGHWLAYSSNQSGSSLIYVQDFPQGETRVPVSDRGASYPEWRRDGGELFYLSSGGELISVPILKSGGFSGGKPKVLFKASIVGTNPYTFTPDAQRFAVQIPIQNAATPVISVVLNWSRSLAN